MAFNVAFVGFLLLLTALVWRWSRRLQQRTGMPAGDVIFADTGAWFPNDTPLHAYQLQLTGKPDYLVEQDDGQIIPVEIKSGKAPVQPHEGHVLQLAAYCLLVDENFGVRPSYGILQYRDRAFAVDFTETLEEDLLDLLADMREDLFDLDLDRDHADWRRCARCSFNQDCDQRLA